VIHDDHIEVEIRLLTQCALDGVQNRALSISDWNNDARANPIVFIRRRHTLETWLEPSADALQMFRRNRLHFPLILTILRINVVELLLTGRARIQHGCRIERFWYPDDRMLFRDS